MTPDAQSRFNHLVDLAEQCDAQARCRSSGRRQQEKYARLAVVYRDMARAIMPAAAMEAALKQTIGVTFDEMASASSSIEKPKNDFYSDPIPW